MKARILLAAALLASAVAPPLAAEPLSDAARLRRQAERDRCGDVRKPCDDAIPDEGRIKACMRMHHARLGPARARICDPGIDG